MGPVRQNLIQRTVRTAHLSVLMCTGLTDLISTSNQNAPIWSLTAAEPSDSVFRALRINWLTYLRVVMG